ncbi:MAG: PEGA domain-containing protein [Planctomycetota bacterium]|nr:PEGA domain-containing protein [Planctomycetota bacterium]
MYRTLATLILLMLASPVLLANPPMAWSASAFSAQGITDQEINDSDKEIGTGPLSITWTGFPEGKSMEVKLFHPDTALAKYAVEDLGNGRRQRVGSLRTFVLYQSYKTVGLLELDPTRFELRDLKGEWLATCVANNALERKSEDPLELDFHWEKCGALDFAGTLSPLRTGEETVRRTPQARAWIQPAGKSKHRFSYYAGRPIQWLKPGQYEVKLFARSYADQTRTVTIVGGETTRVEYHLNKLPGLRDVNIEVHAGPGGLPWMQDGKRLHWGISVDASVSGEHGGYWSADFESVLACGAGREHLEPIYWEDQGGQWIGRSTLYGIPPGELEVSASCTGAGFHKAVTLQPDGNTLVSITLYRNLPGPGWGFRVPSDSGNRRPRFPRLDSREVFVLSADGQWTPLHRFSGSELLVPDRFEQTPERWAYCAPGHKPVFGTDGDFLPSEGGWRVAALKPEPGIQIEYQVVDSVGKPVPNAVCYGDGKEIGRSDEMGVARVDLDSVPRRVWVQVGDLIWNDSAGCLFPRVPRQQAHLRPMSAADRKRINDLVQ